MIDAPTARLTARVFGSGDEVLVLLHGGPGCPDYLRPVAEHLAPRFTVVTFDQRGTGASTADGDRFTVEDYLADLEAVREAVGASRIHLFGHSWGGLYAQLYALAHPERLASLFLSNSALGVGEDWKVNRARALRHYRHRSGWAEVVRLAFWWLVLALPGRPARTAAARVMAIAWRNYFPVPRTAPSPDPAWLAGTSAAAMRRTERPLLALPAATLAPLGLLDLPTAVLYGDDDLFGEGADLVRRRFPSAEHLLLAGTGHVPWLQSPEDFSAALDDFYRRAAGAR